MYIFDLKAAPLREETNMEVVPEAISDSCKVLYSLRLLLGSLVSRLQDSKNNVIVIGFISLVTMFSESKHISSLPYMYQSIFWSSIKWNNFKVDVSTC